MAAHSNAHIVLSREKTEITSDSDDSAQIVVKSNRTAFTISNTDVQENLVVRGFTMPGTLRFTAAVIDRFMEDKEVFRASNPHPPDWMAVWGTTRPEYELAYQSAAWVALYVNGSCLFSTIKTREIDALERAAKGGDVTRKVARTAAQRLSESDDLDVMHDSQIAVVMSVVKSQFKISVLERVAGETKSFAFKIARDKKPVPVPTVLNIAADVIEAMNHNAFLSRVREMASENRRINDPGVTPERVQAVVGRYRDLLGILVGYETAHTIDYFPDKPEFLQFVTPPTR